MELPEVELVEGAVELVVGGGVLEVVGMLEVLEVVVGAEDVVDEVVDDWVTRWWKWMW